MNRTGIVKDRRYMEHVMDPGSSGEPGPTSGDLSSHRGGGDERPGPWEGEASTRHPRGVRDGPLSCLYRSRLPRRRASLISDSTETPLPAQSPMKRHFWQPEASWS